MKWRGTARGLEAPPTCLWDSPHLKQCPQGSLLYAPAEPGETGPSDGLLPLREASAPQAPTSPPSGAGRTQIHLQTLSTEGVTCPPTDVKLQFKLQTNFPGNQSNSPPFWNIPGSLGSCQVSFYPFKWPVPVSGSGYLIKRNMGDLSQHWYIKQRALLISFKLDCQKIVIKAYGHTWDEPEYPSKI